MTQQQTPTGRLETSRPLSKRDADKLKTAWSQAHGSPSKIQRLWLRIRYGAQYRKLP